MLANCVAWGLYGLLIDNVFPLVVTNMIGAVFSLLYLLVYYYYEEHKGSLGLEILATGVILVGLVLYPPIAAYDGTDRVVIQDFVGFVSVAISAIMFASPLVLVKRVIYEQKTEFLPLGMILTGAICSVLWLTYGLLLNDAFVIVPNAGNLCLGLFQLGLFCIYPRSKPYDTIDARRLGANVQKMEKTKSGVEKRDALEGRIRTDEKA
ncbi:hypothetical protein PsorP6_015863 [Peronosclerospora sorghi]|uniref:Uncharacterized protein n=1 Tax=Peronosclerospora sorghi TaxID=230839 RepID=A0ACC0WQ09_9STRA|nr:hypothetical protein PsorP6_015863 [Peronosclerospora sorghi]